MPFCINCGKAQSKLNGNTLCTACYNANNKGSVRSKDNTQMQTHDENNSNIISGDVTKQTSIDKVNTTSKDQSYCSLTIIYARP